jgi:hypothetical protein
MSSLDLRREIIQSEIEIFDRKISAASFTITREFKSLQFGAVNYRARIEMTKQKSILGFDMSRIHLISSKYYK